MQPDPTAHSAIATCAKPDPKSGLIALVRPGRYRTVMALPIALKVPYNAFGHASPKFPAR
jgi:hypothetical protein